MTRVFTATTQQAELVRSVRPSFTLAVDSFDQGAIRKIARAATDVTIKDVEKRRAAVSSSDIATIIYTSGTTGNPKGVALTHANFVATSEGARQVLGDVIDSPETRLLLFLPVAHVLARLVMYVILSGQGVLGFSPNIKNLLPDIKAFKPSVLLVVPRVLEKVYNAGLLQRRAAASRVACSRGAPSRPAPILSLRRRRLAQVPSRKSATASPTRSS